MGKQMLAFWNNHDLLTCSLLLLGIVLFFLVRLERRKLRAREITLLAALISLCVIFNEICVHTIPLHAGTAMVVLSGIVVGPEAGILIGGFARLICNFFDGQGPWTVWEMFSWGLVGGLSGGFFNKVVLRRRIPGERISLADRLSLKKEDHITWLVVPLLCVLFAWLLAWLTWMLGLKQTGEPLLGWRIYVFGLLGLVVGFVLQRRRLSADPYTMAIFTFFIVFLLYGGIMNLATMFLTAAVDETAEVSLSALRALYITGLPYDLQHAASAAFCVFLFGDGILQRIQRIQIKYGVIL